eukprot:364964-Chlamydomonas_euryale.AAC.19
MRSAPSLRPWALQCACSAHDGRGDVAALPTAPHAGSSGKLESPAAASRVPYDVKSDGGDAAASAAGSVAGAIAANSDRGVPHTAAAAAPATGVAPGDMPILRPLVAAKPKARGAGARSDGAMAAVVSAALAAAVVVAVVVASVAVAVAAAVASTAALVAALHERDAAGAAAVAAEAGPVTWLGGAGAWRTCHDALQEVARCTAGAAGDSWPPLWFSRPLWGTSGEHAGLPAPSSLASLPPRLTLGESCSSFASMRRMAGCKKQAGDCGAVSMPRDCGCAAAAHTAAAAAGSTAAASFGDRRRGGGTERTAGTRRTAIGARPRSMSESCGSQYICACCWCCCWCWECCCGCWCW